MFGKRLPAIRIPADWADVDARWVEAALAARHPDAKVAAVTLLTRDDGTNRRARFAVEYAAGEGPERLFVKAHAPAHRLVHLRNGNLFGEARLFAAGAALPVDHPIVYRAKPDYLHLDFLLVMEDLTARGADPRDATRPMTPEQVASGLTGLARLHARYWNAWPRQLRWVKRWAPSQGWQVGLRKRVPTGLARATGTLPGEVARLSGDEVVDRWAAYVTTLARGPATLLHGDAHIGNTYVLPDDTVGFLDWQVVRRGAWHQDMGYFLTSALTVEDRRAHERELLDMYLAALDVPDRPSRDDAWALYRTTPAYGLAIWLSTLGTDGWQSREICLALVDRFAAAYAELGTERPV